MSEEKEERGPRRVRLGSRELEFPSPSLQPLHDDSALLHDPAALRARLQHQGYVFIRGLHAREDVFAARLAVLQHIRDSGADKLDSHVAWQEGKLNPRCGLGCVPFLEGKNNITHSQAVLRVLEGPRPKAFFRSLFDEEAQTFDYKWLRGVHREAYTGAHVDWVYMGWGTDTLYTMWTPLDDVPVEMGTLAMCEGSHSLPGFKKFQDTYGNLDLEKSGISGTGWFTRDPWEITSQFGGQWKTTDYRAGDAIIFTMRTVHMSTANLTDKVRLSCDTRWHPVSQASDPRYVGDMKPVEPKYGLAAATDDDFESLKKAWGFSKP